MGPRPRLLLVPLVAALCWSGCTCEQQAPKRAGHPAPGKTRIVEAAFPEGDAGGSTMVHSDLSVPPRDGDLGWWPGLALDASGRPYLSYTDAYNGELHYAVWDGDHFAVTRVDTYGAVGKYTAIAVGPRGRPSIVYYNQDKQRLLYATFAGPGKVDPKDPRTPWQGAKGWMFEMIDNGPEIGMADHLVADPDGTLHAFYYASNQQLVEAVRPPTAAGVHATWTHRVVDPKAGGSHSIVLGYARAKDGTRYLSYANWDVFNSDLRLATRKHGADKWKVDKITGKDNAGWKSGVFLDDAGKPVIIYLALLKRQLRMARPGKDPGSWEITPLVDDANTMAVVRAKDGKVILAYEYLPHEGLEGATVRYLVRDDAHGDLTKGWKRYDVAGAAMSSYLVLAPGADGHPVMAWYDGTIRGVRLHDTGSLPTTQAPASAGAAPAKAADGAPKKPTAPSGRRARRAPGRR